MAKGAAATPRNVSNDAAAATIAYAAAATVAHAAAATVFHAALIAETSVTVKTVGFAIQVIESIHR